jgi:hypothetical protein
MSSISEPVCVKSQSPNGGLTLSNDLPNGLSFCKYLKLRNVYGLTGKLRPGKPILTQRAASMLPSESGSNPVQPSPTQSNPVQPSQTRGHSPIMLTASEWS